MMKSFSDLLMLHQVLDELYPLLDQVITEQEREILFASQVAACHEDGSSWLVPCESTRRS